MVDELLHVDAEGIVRQLLESTARKENSVGCVHGCVALAKTQLLLQSVQGQTMENHQVQHPLVEEVKKLERERAKM